MKSPAIFLSLIISSFSISITGCSSNGPEPAPMLDLSPQILLDSAEHGEDIIIKLNVINQISNTSVSAYAVEDNLRELFTDLLSDSLEEQGFEVITDDDDEIDTIPVYYNVLIQQFTNSIKKSSLSSEITAEISLELRATNNRQEFIKKYNSRRFSEVALSPSIDEMENLTNLAIAQIIRRLVNDKELQSFSIRSVKK